MRNLIHIEPAATTPQFAGPHLDATFMEEDRQPVPLVGDVDPLLAEAPAARDARALFVEPYAEGDHQRHGFDPSDELVRR